MWASAERNEWDYLKLIVQVLNLNLPSKITGLSLRKKSQVFQLAFNLQGHIITHKQYQTPKFEKLQLFLQILKAEKLNLIRASWIITIQINRMNSLRFFIGSHYYLPPEVIYDQPGELMAKRPYSLKRNNISDQPGELMAKRPYFSKKKQCRSYSEPKALVSENK